MMPATERGTLVPGTLRARVTGATERAFRSGALQPIPTRIDFLEQAGVRFQVRVATRVSEKHSAPDGANPFLPYDEELFVSGISATHVGLLNKFNVVDHHLLLVTREFEDQESLLTLRDFEAIWVCMAEYDALAFHNGGVVAGASQPHKHLQIVPVPLAPGTEGTPVDRLLAGENAPGLPFLHRSAPADPGWTGDPQRAAVECEEIYRKMLRETGLREEGGRVPPYNLLLTRRWLLLVPRARERFETVSVNALGFAGSLLVWNDREFRRLWDAGPMTALAAVTFPAGSASTDR